MICLKKMMMYLVTVVATGSSCEAQIDRYLSKQKMADLAVLIQTFADQKSLGKKQFDIAQFQRVLQEKDLDKNKVELVIEFLGVDLGIVLLSGVVLMGLFSYFLCKGERCNGHGQLSAEDREWFMGPYAT